MGAKSEALARQFESKVQKAMATLEKLSDADWKKVTHAEKWSVGVTAHHYASALEPICQAIEGIVAGHSLALTNEMINQGNAEHAKEYANCTKAETIELFKKGSAVAAGVIRGLSDEQMAKSGTVLQGVPPMTAEQLITGALLDHIDEHFGSIRKTIGN